MNFINFIFSCKPHFIFCTKKIQRIIYDNNKDMKYSVGYSLSDRLIMDMFNKLKSAVSSALPGNPLSKDFEVYGQIGTAGPGLLWKIYSGMKKTTKQV